MKKYNFLLILLFAAWSFQSCNSSTSNDDSVDSAKEANDMKDSNDNNMMNDSSNAMAGTMSVSEDESKFMVNAASGGMMEVELGKLAQQKATNQRVKDFGSMMVTDHTKANDELKSLAAKKNVTLPMSMGDDHQKDMNDLMKKSGKDFDKAYMNMMVDDHKDDIDDFQKCYKNGTDADLKAFTQKTLPVLSKHLDAARAINDVVKK